MSLHPIQKHPPLPHPHQHAIPTLSCDPPNVLTFTFASHRTHPTPQRPPYLASSCRNNPFKNTHPSPIRINTPYLHFCATPQMCSHSHLHPTAPTQPHKDHRTSPFHVHAAKKQEEDKNNVAGDSFAGHSKGASRKIGGQVSYSKEQLSPTCNRVGHRIEGRCSSLLRESDASYPRGL